MGRISDMVLKLDWESTPTHTIEYDPNVETETLQGRNGPFDVVTVRENNINVHMALSNQTLVRQLQKITQPSKLRITRTGTSYDTKFTVENQGPITRQAEIRK